MLDPRSRGDRRADVQTPRLSDVPTALAAAMWVLAARAVIARRGFPGAIEQYRLRPADDAGAAGPPLSDSARRAAAVAARVVRMRGLGASCLPRSIAMARVVASRGARADIVLGVTSIDGFEAHAWVEAGGERLDPSGYPDGVYQAAGRFTLGR
jgi:hypothetical protein